MDQSTGNGRQIQYGLQYLRAEHTARVKILALITRLWFAPIRGFFTLNRAREFRSQETEVITSCCGSVYNEGAEGLGANLAGASAGFILPLFFSIVILLLLNRFVFKRRDAGKKWLGNLLEFPLWIAFFITAIVVIISFISTYVYEMLSHSCPFCFMGAEYHYYGVALYLCLFVATATGMTGGLLETIQRPETLAQKARLLQKKMNTVSLWGMLAFVVIGFLPFATYYIKTGRLI